MKSARPRRANRTSRDSEAKSGRGASSTRVERADSVASALLAGRAIRLPGARVPAGGGLAAAVKNKRAREIGNRAAVAQSAEPAARSPRPSAERSGSFDRTAPRAGLLPEAFPTPSPRTALAVRTAMTPRPDIHIPGISVENVDWEDASEPVALSPHARWASSERELKNRVESFGTPVSGCRADIRAGRFYWVDESGCAVVEARVQVVCTLAIPSLVLTMAWADPILASVSVPRVRDQPDEASLPDDETACEIAMRITDGGGAEFVYRMPAPHVDYFLALRALEPSARVATPGSPVGLVLRGLADLRRSLDGRSEPTSDLRARFHRVGKTFIDRAATEFKDTEWVGRLRRGGKLVMSLAARLSPPTFTAIAAGLPSGDSLPENVAIELRDAIRLMEDEWKAFAV